MTEYYIDWRLIDNKPRWIIVNKNKEIINRNPNKDELKGLKRVSEKNMRGPRRKEQYNSTNICEHIENSNRCENKLYPGNARQFNINGKSVWVCERHSSKYRNSHDAIKSIADSRIDNLDSDSPKGKGDPYQLLACKLKGWIDLNKENDNYGFPIDCYDPKTGLFHQIKGRRYSPKYGTWSFGRLEIDRHKKFEDTTCYCTSKEGKIIERKYRFPKKETKNITGITITKNPSRGTQWYEEYRIKDEEELKMDNEMWQKINISKVSKNEI